MNRHQGLDEFSENPTKIGVELAVAVVLCGPRTVANLPDGPTAQEVGLVVHQPGIRVLEQGNAMADLASLAECETLWHVTHLVEDKPLVSLQHDTQASARGELPR